MSQTQRVLKLNGRTITLIGTAHVSAESITEVKETIKSLKPDCVAVELDEKRADSIKNTDKYKQLDIIKVLRRNEGFLLMANLVLASFQRRMGQNIGVKPGDEMLAGIQTAEEMNIPVVMADRPIQVTLKRAWAKNSLWGKCKLLSALLTSMFSKEEMTAEQIEEIKEKNCSFSAGQYFEVKIEYVELTPEEFNAKMVTYKSNLNKYFNENKLLEDEINKSLEELKYES